MKGTLLACTGDNLGSHQIGGFLESFSLKNYFCRFCYAHDISKLNFTEKNVSLRTKDSYEIDVNIIQTLNELNFFHVCNPGLPPCIAHDLFEGIVQYDLMLALDLIISKKMISLLELNNKIASLNFPFENNINYPILTKKNQVLPGTASQNMWLILVMPFLLYNNTDIKESNIFQMINLLRKICLIILGFKISISQVAFLKFLIDEYLTCRKEILSESSFKPKHHFLIHYPYLIRMFGPLRHLWTLRFESKHQYFKKVVKHSTNFKNIMFSLTEKHQLLQSLSSSKNLLFSNHIISENAEVYLPHNFPEDFNQIVSCCFSCKENLFVSYDVNYQNVLYKKGMVLCIRKTGFLSFNLLKIEAILIYDNFNSVSFYGSNINVTCDRETYLLYPNGSNESKCLIYFKDLLTHETLFHYFYHTENSYIYIVLNQPLLKNYKILINIIFFPYFVIFCCNFVIIFISIFD